jgi:hypothetical protein
MADRAQCRTRHAAAAGLLAVTAAALATVGLAGPRPPGTARLDHADSRISGMSSQFLAELAVIKRHGEQTSARQDRLGTDLPRLAAQLSGEPEPSQAAVPDGATSSGSSFP